MKKGGGCLSAAKVFYNIGGFDFEPASLFAAVDAGDDAAFQKIQAGSLADVADAIHLILGNVFRVACQDLLIICFFTHLKHLNAVIWSTAEWVSE